LTRAVGRRFGHVFFDLDGTLVDPREESVAVRWEYDSLDELTAARPDAIVESTSELIEYICRADAAPKRRGDRP
jgi:phosphoglycolate phosphatase-like HAD superfamily hydrolase